MDAVEYQIEDIIYSYVKDSTDVLSFSGGLDSTLLLYLSGMTLKPVVAGFNGSHDVERAMEVSNILGITLKKIILDDIDLKDHIKRIKDIDPSVKRQEIGYELVLSVVLENSGGNAVVTGQGADEIFYGYHDLVISQISNLEHLHRLVERTLPREKKMAEEMGKELITPYLDEKIVDICSKIPRSHHVSNGTGKLVLRSIAKLSGVPESLYQYPKKAAQYGSGIDRFLKSVGYYGLL